MKMVGAAGNAPVVTSDFVFRHRFYRPAAGSPPEENSKSEIQNPKQFQNSNFEFVSKFGFEIGSGSGNHTHLKEFMRLLSVH